MFLFVLFLTFSIPDLPLAPVIYLCWIQPLMVVYAHVSETAFDLLVFSVGEDLAQYTNLKNHIIIYELMNKYDFQLEDTAGRQT